MALDDEADLFCADDDVLLFTADADGLGSLEDDDAAGAGMEDFLFCGIFAEDCLLLAADSVRGIDAPWLILFGFMEADFLPPPPNKGFLESMVSWAASVLPGAPPSCVTVSDPNQAKVIPLY